MVRLFDWVFPKLFSFSQSTPFTWPPSEAVATPIQGPSDPEAWSTKDSDSWFNELNKVWYFFWNLKMFLIFAFFSYPCWWQDGYTALLAAANKGDAEIVVELLQFVAAGAIDINFATCSKLYKERNPTANFGELNHIRSGRTALQLAAMNGHIEVVRTLLKVPGIDVNGAKQMVRNCLSSLFFVGFLSFPSLSAQSTYSPLIFAAEAGHIEVVKLLLAVENVNIHSLGSVSIHLSTC